MTENPNWIAIHERITSVEGMVREARDDTRDLIEYLRGNGQPGVINQLDDRVVSLELNHATARAWVKGAAWVIGGLLTAAGTAMAILW